MVFIIITINLRIISLNKLFKYVIVSTFFDLVFNINISMHVPDFVKYQRIFFILFHYFMHFLILFNLFAQKIFSIFIFVNISIVTLKNIKKILIYSQNF